MSRPELPEGTLNKEIIENNATPWLILKPKKRNMFIFAYSWAHMCKIYAWTRQDEKAPAKLDKWHELILVNKYICGFTFIDENFLIFEFDESEPHKPNYAVYSEKNDLLYKGDIKHAEMYKQFSGIHYRTSTLKSNQPNGECILYNPESVFKVQPITLKERILFLLSKKRIFEWVQLVNDNEASLQLDIIKRVRNAHLDQLLRDKNFPEAARLLPVYCKDNKQQWEHWIKRFKQKYCLGYITEIIPVGNPIKLDKQVYTLILNEFLKQKDFGNLLIWTERFKPHLLDYSEITKLMNEIYDMNNELIQNSLFFKTIQRVAEYTDNKILLLIILIKSKSLRVYDIIRDPGNILC